MTSTSTSIGIRIGWTMAAIAISAIRLAGTRDELFQAIAHLLVGGWFAAWVSLATARRQAPDAGIRPGFYGWLFLGPSLVEAYAFLAGIGR